MYFIVINRPKRKIIAETSPFGDSNRWPGGVIPYVFTSNIGRNYFSRKSPDQYRVFFVIDFGVRQRVMTAIQHWHQRTCIRFEPYNPQRHRGIDGVITIEDSGAGFVLFSV